MKISQTTRNALPVAFSAQRTAKTDIIQQAVGKMPSCLHVSSAMNVIDMSMIIPN